MPPRHPCNPIKMSQINVAAIQGGFISIMHCLIIIFCGKWFLDLELIYSAGLLLKISGKYFYTEGMRAEASATLVIVSPYVLCLSFCPGWGKIWKACLLFTLPGTSKPLSPSSSLSSGEDRWHPMSKNRAKMTRLPVGLSWEMQMSRCTNERHFGASC